MNPFGAEYNFVNEPSNDQLCPVCMEPMMQPFLTDCGHYLCYTCRGRLLASGKDECPECREPNGAKDARMNKHLQRQVKSLMVRCQHYQAGCQWVGELMYLKEHLDPLLKRCGFIFLACPLGCGKRVRSSVMEEHIRSLCNKRLCACEYCGYYSSHGIVTEQHYPVCELFPVECPNKCFAVENMKRMQLKMHLEEQCPLQVIQCPFSSAGCTVQLPRRAMEEHEDKAMRQHVHMMMSLHSKPVASSPSQLYLFSLTPLEFTIGDFLKMKQFNAEWVSPPFYTHPHGYKLCLVVYPNGIEIGKGSHVSVFVGLLKGAHDDQLAWPMELDVTIKLLNCREDKNHHELTLTMNSDCYLVSKNGIKLSPNGLQFIHHSFLPYRNSTITEYLQNNSLRLRLNTPTIHPRTTLVPLKDLIGNVVYEFTMTEFSKHKQSNDAFHSPSFYTHYQGYKMCLRVYANGDRDAKDTHVSVFVFIMAGDHDEQLQWPFIGDIVIELVNWREDKRHHTVTLSISVISHFYKVTEGSIGYSFGFDEFITHSSLPYNRSTNTEYLRNDSLRLRVKEVAVYSTPLLLKTPSWQNPHGVSQSVYECTLTEFSKRRLLNSTFDSTPFYTHRHGYRLCLSVYANGCGNGENTHVSVYVTILAGDHDDKLQWPLVGNIDIELLNWRADKRHYKMTISIFADSGFTRVLSGVVGQSRGYSRFIAHPSLRYWLYANTEYLQNDCLRFRVNTGKLLTVM